MAKRKITTAIRRIVLRENNLAPYRGVRELARLLESKHKIKISKSTIANILKSKSCQLKSGPKKATARYQRKQSSQCGLLLLKSLDSHIGLVDRVVKELNPTFPAIPAKTLKKVVLFLSFSYFCAKEPFYSKVNRDFLKLAGLGQIPSRLISHITKILNQTNKLTIDLSSLAQEVGTVTTIKFTFNDGTFGYCDAGMNTFWSGLCRFERFFATYRSATAKLLSMVKDGVFLIGYTRSLDYISLTTFAFMASAAGGLEKIEMIDETGAAVLELPFKQKKASFLFGYSPQVLKKGVIPVSGTNRLRHIVRGGNRELYGKIFQARLSCGEPQEELFFSSTLIKDKIDSEFNWGIFSNIPKSRRNFITYIRKYINAHRYAAGNFFQDMKAIEEEALGCQHKPSDLSRLIPKRLVIADCRDFAKIAQILSIIFKEIVGGWEPKAKKGSWHRQGDLISAHIAGVPGPVKANFNKKGFFIGKKRVVII
jgi:hypothetical protein